MSESRPTILDASAILAVLLRESGSEEVWPWLPDGLLSTVNLAEVIGKLVARKRPLEEAIRDVQELPIRIIAFDEHHSSITASLITQTKEYGLSIGDRACLALGMIEHGVVITSDQNMAQVDVGISVKVFR